MKDARENPLPPLQDQEVLLDYRGAPERSRAPSALQQVRGQRLHSRKKGWRLISLFWEFTACVLAILAIGVWSAFALLMLYVFFEIRGDV